MTKSLSIGWSAGLVAMVFLFSLCAFGQDATVVELSSADAAQAKELYAAKVAADKAWDQAYSKIIGKYRDFSYGAEFSKDFRFIVPKSTSSPSVLIGSSVWPSGCSQIYNTPCTNSGVFTLPQPQIFTSIN